LAKGSEKKETRIIARDYGLAIGLSIFFAVSVRFAFFEAYRMPSSAMYPAIEPGDTLFASKISYGLRVPGLERRLFAKNALPGDVIVFEFPDDPGRSYVKRVIAVPGDRVSIRDGRAIIGGQSIANSNQVDDRCAEEKHPEGKTYSVCFEEPLMRTEKELTVPPDHVFVVGDLRASSQGTKKLKPHGLVPIKLIHGKADIIWLSIQPSSSAGGDWFSRIRFNRLFKPIH
jgi:signal peptidase I